MASKERDSTSAGNGLNAYATLLTRPSYLAGAITLAYTLYKHSPSTPLVILYTPETLPEPSVKALQTEAKHTNAIPYPVEHLRLPATKDDEEHGMVAERFIDTWTKLRVFEVLELEGKKVDRLCFLDADMMIFSSPSPFIFNASNDAYITAEDGMRICATHACVCNLDHDAWAPKSWTPQNCAFTHLTSPDQLATVKNEPETMGMFNSGTFLFHPSPTLRSFVLDKFHNTPVSDLRKLKFPDQDFLNIVFHSRWTSLSWRTNALKTWRYWHPDIWRDDSVAVLHYIVDKPWAARVTRNGEGEPVAGYKGDDGETHSWWWDEYGKWVKERKAQGEEEFLLDTVGKYVAGEQGEESEEMRAIGGRAQDYAKKWENGEQEEQNTKARGGGEEQEKEEGQADGPHGPVLRKPMLGERGHGPVVRSGGRGLRGRAHGLSYVED